MTGLLISLINENVIFVVVLLLMSNPIYIITLKIDEQSLLFFDLQRDKHFPATNNYLKAHLTLFHHICLSANLVSKTIEKEVAHIAPFYLQVTNLINLGKGVAYSLKSEELSEIHAGLQKIWFNELTNQDKQKLRPHITVQNKVDVDVAKSTMLELAKDFKPFEVKALGVSVWEYLGGPWRFIDEVCFKG